LRLEQRRTTDGKNEDEGGDPERAGVDDQSCSRLQQALCASSEASATVIAATIT